MLKVLIPAEPVTRMLETVGTFTNILETDRIIVAVDSLCDGSWLNLFLIARIKR